MGSVKGWELEALAPDARLDLRGGSWPLATVQTQLELDQMHCGQILELLVSGGATLTEAAERATEHGCRLLKVEALSDDTGFRIWVERC